MQDESRDPAIKLFGKRIHLPADGEISGISADEFEKAKCSSRESEEEEEQEIEKTEQDSLAENTTDTGQEDNNSLSNGAESTNPETLAEPNENPKTPSIDEESGKPKTGEIDKEQKDAGNSQEKTLKKPDKILPCPRCNSMDTKFCYYNNYNINQPRHFCKACQRYWTAGGTMRNVPVGAGRRKNKNSSSHYRHISISEALQAARIDAPHGTHHHPALKSNGKVLSFGVDAPISDYMASVLNLREKNVLSGTRNGFHCLEEQKPSAQCREEKGDDCTSRSSVTVSKSTDEEGKSCIQETMMGNINGFPSPIPCLPGMPWPYPWNPAMPPPAFCPSAYPMPFYPAAPYWSCGIPGAWNIPLLSPQSSSSSNMKAPTSGPNSPMLGKHSREGDTVKLDDSEKEKLSKQKNGSVLVPKTLRIDDPSEAAKSSIWATLGIKNESLSGGGLYKAFHPKGNEKNHIAEASPALRANPAALSRSINFHESS